MTVHPYPDGETTHGYVSSFACGAGFGVHLRTVSLWMARHQLAGFDGLKERRRGRRPREQMALTDAEQAELIAVMKGSNPDQLQLPGVLWSWQAVKALIERRFGVALSRQTVGVYLRPSLGVLGQEATAPMAGARSRAAAGVA